MSTLDSEGKRRGAGLINCRALLSLQRESCGEQ